MKLCDRHDTALKAELTLHALDIPADHGDPDQQFARLATMSFVNFDPYLFAKNTLMVSAAAILTSGCLGTDLCPVCAVEKKHKSICTGGDGCEFQVEEWIPESVRSAKETLMKLCGGTERTH